MYGYGIFIFSDHSYQVFETNLSVQDYKSRLAFAQDVLNPNADVDKTWRFEYYDGDETLQLDAWEWYIPKKLFYSRSSAEGEARKLSDNWRKQQRRMAKQAASKCARIRRKGGLFSKYEMKKVRFYLPLIPSDIVQVEVCTKVTEDGPVWVPHNAES